MQNSKVQHKHFTELDILRSIATIGVFLHHILWTCGMYSYVSNAFGDCFVAFFFILSGFLTTKSQHENHCDDNITIKSAAQFITKKIIKLYPVYLICFILVIALNEGIKYTPIKVILLNALMLQSWIPHPAIYFSVNSVSWFISSLMFCYIMFLLVYKLMTNYPRTFWSIAGILYIAYFIVIHLIPDKLALPIIYICPIMQFFAFMFGMILWRIFTKTICHKSFNFGIAKLICWLSLIASLALCCYVPARYLFAPYWWPFWGAIILVTATAAIQKQPTDTFNLVTKPAFIFSKLCYPFFMLHPIVISTYLKICHNSGFGSPALLTITATFIATTAFSAAINHIINAFRTIFAKQISLIRKQ